MLTRQLNLPQRRFLGGGSDMEICNTFWQNAIAVEKRVAFAIWCLWTRNSLFTVSKVFSIGLSSSSQICMELCKIMLKLVHDFIKFPQNGQETGIAICRFQKLTNIAIPIIVAVINETHFEINSPDTENTVDYYSRKQKYTIRSQGIVQYNLNISNIAIGYSGSLHDARILRSSFLYLKKAESGDIFDNRTAKVVDGYRIKPLILCDSLYLSTTWQVKLRNFYVNRQKARDLSTNNFLQFELQWKELLGSLKVIDAAF